MVQALVGNINRLVIDSADLNGFAARGTVREGKLALTLAATLCDGCRIDGHLLGVDRMASVATKYGATWAPLMAMIFDAQGERAAPGHFESPDRSDRARLIELIVRPVAELSDLQSFAAAAALIENTPLA